jgi:hypothetical protein
VRALFSSLDVLCWRKLIALNAAFCPARFDANVFPRPVAAWMLAALRQKKYRNAGIGEDQ